MATVQLNDKDAFKAYLDRLSCWGDSRKLTANISFESTNYCDLPSELKEFIQTLASQKAKHHEETKEATEKQKHHLQASLAETYDFRPEINGFVNFMKQFVKTLEQIEKNKSDVDASASSWKIDRFLKYIDTLNVRFVPASDLSAGNLPDDIFSTIQQRYQELEYVYLGAPVTQDLELDQEFFLQRLVYTEYREAASRVFVDALTTPILFKNKMQVRLEEKLYRTQERNPGVPNCIADYVVYNKMGEILGAIETKNGGKIKAESVIQCMLQLLSLRWKAQHTLFGVITDAVSYIFIVLTKDGTFEFETDGHHDVTTWKDLHTVASIFNGLLQRREREREQEYRNEAASSFN